MGKINTLLCLKKYWVDFLSIGLALKQTKAGPRSLGTPGLGNNNFM